MNMPIVKLSDRFAETDIDGEIVIMRLETGDFYSLSGSAPAIWRLIDGTRDRAAILAALRHDFSGNEEEMGPDLDGFISQFTELGLLADG